MVLVIEYSLWCNENFTMCNKLHILKVLEKLLKMLFFLSESELSLNLSKCDFDFFKNL